MARQICQTLITKLNPTRQSMLASQRKFFSGNKSDLIEVDLDSSSSSSSSSGGGEIEVVGGLQRLEDAIHTIISRRLAPDWLPFSPGSSYWVPPRRPSADSIVELVGKLTNPLSEEESLSLSSARGWPSSSFFLDDQGSLPSLPVVEVHVYSPKSNKVPVSEDED